MLPTPTFPTQETIKLDVGDFSDYTKTFGIITSKIVGVSFEQYNLYQP